MKGNKKLHIGGTIRPKSLELESMASNHDSKQIEEVVPSIALKNHVEEEQKRKPSIVATFIREDDPTPTVAKIEPRDDKAKETTSIPEQVAPSNATVHFDPRIFIRRPSPYKPSDPRFYQVQVRRFVGKKETPFSLFEDCFHSLVFHHSQGLSSMGIPSK